MTARIDDRKSSEYWKTITCIMMICASHQNKEILAAAQYSRNTTKTIRHEVENCNEDYKAVARRKKHNRQSNCVRKAEFIKILQKKVV